MTLFIDGCVREQSRTRELAQAVLDTLGTSVQTVSVNSDWPAPLSRESLALRDELLHRGDLDHPLLRFARQFAAADEIVMAAPYWDLLFPAAVRAYFEAVTVSGITFGYDEHGIPHGLCRAKHFTFVTTAGGPIIGNFGFAYAEALCRGFYGIETVRCISAEGLDVVGADVPAILAEAKKGIVSAGK